MTRIQNRRATATEWAAANPVLADGEIGYERATGKFKIGDGSTAWNSLPYATAGGYALDVKDKGAKGDGATDDTAAFAAAVTAVVAAGGGTVRVPAGTFVLNRLALASNVTLLGSGKGITILKLSSAASDGAWVLRCNSDGDSTSANTHVRGLTIDGNKDVFGAGDTKRLYGYYLGTNIAANVKNCTVADVEFKNCKTYAMDVVRAAGVTIKDCISHDNGYTTGTNNSCSGFEILGDDVRIVDCYAWANSNKGFIAGEGGVAHYRIFFVDCLAYDNVNEGFYFHDLVEGSGIDGGSSYRNLRGVAFNSNAIRCFCRGVSVYANTGNGIRVDGSTYISVIGNICSANSTASSGNPEIYLTNGSFCVVVGNLVNSVNSSTSIVEQGTSNNNQFAENVYNKTFTIVGAASSVGATVAALAGLQPLDSDLTSIAALTASNDDLIQRKSGVWVNRTPAQVKVDLGVADQGGFLPADHGLLVWTYDPIIATTGSPLATNGLIYTTRIKVPAGMTINNIETFLTSAAAGLTAGQNFAALYTNAGVLIAQTVDQSTAWASGGIKPMALTTPQVVTAGTYIIAIWSNATTRPTILRSSSQSSNNLKLSNAASRYGTADASVTTTAPSTLGTIAASGVGAWWFGLS